MQVDNFIFLRLDFHWVLEQVFSVSILVYFSTCSRHMSSLSHHFLIDFWDSCLEFSIFFVPVTTFGRHRSKLQHFLSRFILFPTRYFSFWHIFLKFVFELQLPPVKILRICNYELLTLVMFLVLDISNILYFFRLAAAACQSFQIFLS